MSNSDKALFPAPQNGKLEERDREILSEIIGKIGICSPNPISKDYSKCFMDPSLTLIGKLNKCLSERQKWQKVWVSRNLLYILQHIGADPIITNIISLIQEALVVGTEGFADIFVQELHNCAMYAHSIQWDMILVQFVLPLYITVFRNTQETETIQAASVNLCYLLTLIDETRALQFFREALHDFEMDSLETYEKWLSKFLRGMIASCPQLIDVMLIAKMLRKMSKSKNEESRIEAVTICGDLCSAFRPEEIFQEVLWIFCNLCDNASEAVRIEAARQVVHFALIASNSPKSKQVIYIAKSLSHDLCKNVKHEFIINLGPAILALEDYQHLHLHAYLEKIYRICENIQQVRETDLINISRFITKAIIKYPTHRKGLYRVYYSIGCSGRVDAQLILAKEAHILIGGADPGDIRDFLVPLLKQVVEGGFLQHVDEETMEMLLTTLVASIWERKGLLDPVMFGHESVLKIIQAHWRLRKVFIKRLEVVVEHLDEAGLKEVLEFVFGSVNDCVFDVRRTAINKITEFQKRAALRVVTERIKNEDGANREGEGNESLY